MCYKRSNTTVAERTYTYDALGRPLTRTTSRDVQSVTDSFGYNNRSELTTATVNNGTYAYDNDNIGNRKTAQEAEEEITGYSANNLNQYTALTVDGDVDFQPEYDDDGNQTRVKTSTGIWAISYDAENRPTDFTSQAADGTITTVHCEYDYMGRRTTKMVTVGNNVTLQQRYIYRGYLQIACIDLTRSHRPALWYITWDPTQSVATRPLAIRKDGTWYTCGWDLTKNVCEVYGPAGYIRTAYTYTPYGEVTATGDVTQPIQWSSEYYDTDLCLSYYNYRHYNPVDGRWIGRDAIGENSTNCLYSYINNRAIWNFDILGMTESECNKNNLGTYQNLKVEIKAFSLLYQDKGYAIADTSDFSLSKHIKKAAKDYIKKKAGEKIDDYLRKKIESYKKIKDLYDELKEYEGKRRGGLSPELFAELTSSAGGILKYVEINVEADFCCCIEGEFKFLKSSASAKTPDYNVSLKSPSMEDINKLKKIPRDLANASAQAVRSLYEHKCKAN